MEESMKKRFDGAEKALGKLHEGVIKDSLTEMERDGLIQRFEFAFEIMWKCGKDYLLDREGLEAASPKKVIRLLREVGLFSDEEAEQALQMADDRNLTAHTYDEKMAVDLAKRIVEHEKLLSEWLGRMKD
ncbi:MULTISPECIES: HI0074 family nucleotidyltransferase substrate-binding subunit [unclassified Selenomonas]|uniref:HI0074 family nucleotidyltransferase substrate-binding subunit n=1 Tax=unclassified Selenomonas TaxID=2637378 RepID=UPI0008A74977|nr:nucleotidyltransferase substrate binding protein, HI0074 family [Selenomonas ruminantium]